MNKTEREILYRMHCLLTAVPLPITGGGTQSASMTGFVSFGQDMAEVRPHLDNVWGLFNFKEYDKVKKLRQMLFQVKPVEAMEALVKRLTRYTYNDEFLEEL